MVQHGVSAIQNGVFKKVVLSRAMSLEQTINLSELYIKASENYPTAFVSLHYTPEYGYWLGATPEMLLTVENSMLRTVALAGTQFENDDTNLKNAVWNQKEIEEQALVSRYVINCFKSIRLREFEEDGPKTIKAGKLLHLKTDFWVDLQEVKIDGLADTLSTLLHPTSAVGGMPREEAIQFIMENEKYNRQLYAGFIGPQNIDNDGDCQFYVNIRCLNWKPKNVVLFAGAGITADSVPEKEWIETENKLGTLLKVLVS